MDTTLQTEAKVGHKKSHLKTLCAQISEATFTSEASWAEGHPGGRVPARTVTVKGGSWLNREARGAAAGRGLLPSRARSGGSVNMTFSVRVQRQHKQRDLVYDASIPAGLPEQNPPRTPFAFC